MINCFGMMDEIRQRSSCLSDFGISSRNSILKCYV